MVQEVPYNLITHETPHHIFIFPPCRARAAREGGAAQRSEANQQCHFKSSRCCIELLRRHGFLPRNSSHGTPDVYKQLNAASGTYKVKPMIRV
jgi:hypothetical protein